MPGAPAFQRDRLTWLAYAMLGVYGLILALLGPAMPLLRSDLGLDRSRGGLHFTAVALGVVLVGVVAARVIARIGRRTAFWGGAAGMATGAVMIGLGHHLAVTLGGAFLQGALGTLLLTSLQAALADRHRTRRAVALTEGNVLASVGTVLAPLLVGGMARLWLGWRAAFLVPAVLVAILALAAGRTEIPRTRVQTGVPRRRGVRLPAGFWVYGATVIPAVAAEWSLVGWGAGYLVDERGLVEADGTLLMTFFFLAMTVGRLVGTRLVRHSDVDRLLLGTLGVALAGSLIFSLAPWTWGAVTGLFMAGLGIASLFPFLLSLALEAVPDQADAGSARLVQIGGVAVLVAPQSLGLIADQAGIGTAMLLVPALLLVAAVTVTVGRYLSRDTDEGQPGPG